MTDTRGHRTERLVSGERFKVRASSGTPEERELIERLTQEIDGIEMLDMDGNPNLLRDIRTALQSRIEEVERLEEALERIAGMTDIEADFDGFEAREIASAALNGTGAH